MRKIIFIFLTLLLSINVKSQNKELNFVVKPYLQDAEPHSIIVMWESSLPDESIVEYGTTKKLGKTAKGISFDINYSDTRVHEVKLTGLKPFTSYYYRVKTKKLKSETFKFKTPPHLHAHEHFNILAMSDMQNGPKFTEIANKGVLDYFSKNYKGDLSDNLALVMVPGDLVNHGHDYDQWNNEFFTPANKIFSQVPLYPVRVNHEYNSDFYFKYFSLPKNGTPAYSEHWWYKDYGNVRILGLDSNHGYRNIKDQEKWLVKVLAETEKNDAIDFVFAQLHHPHKSELWIAGEIDFTGEVIKLLENFSTKSGKPSLHFFGHTHGYERGQSKNHKHLWINVSAAGGTIDNWGEYKQINYDEFTVTQDEYGFVIVEVNADKNDPSFKIKRISRGNEEHPRNNELRDSITVYKNNKKPKTPIAISPINTAAPVKGVVLKANKFKADSPAFHAASQWQISKTKDFEKPVYDSWKQFEDWYFMEDRQKNDDLTDELMNLEKSLEPNKTYYWRVRYRDQYLNWSDWSSISSFKTR